MGETFMSAVTKIDDLVTKRKQIIEKTASLLAEAILDRIKCGNLTRNSEKDIKNAIKAFTIEEQNEILVKTIIYVGMNNTKNHNSDDDDEFQFNGKKVNSRSDLFRRRFDD